MWLSLVLRALMGLLQGGTRVPHFWIILSLLSTGSCRLKWIISHLKCSWIGWVCRWGWLGHTLWAKCSEHHQLPQCYRGRTADTELQLWGKANDSPGKRSPPVQQILCWNAWSSHSLCRDSQKQNKTTKKTHSTTPFISLYFKIRTPYK